MSASAIVTGVLLGTYEDNRFKSESKKPTLKALDFIGSGVGSDLEKKLKHTEDVCTRVILGKELVNSPANVFTPVAVPREKTYPKFQLYPDATRLATVSILDASTGTLYIKEMIIKAPSSSIDVCLCCATTGSPFLSTLELRPLNLSMYATDFEDNFYLKVAARVNFGAASTEPIRYPDGPYDRIWDSDLAKR